MIKESIGVEYCTTLLKYLSKLDREVRCVVGITSKILYLDDTCSTKYSFKLICGGFEIR